MYLKDHNAHRNPTIRPTRAVILSKSLCAISHFYQTNIN